MPGLGGGHGTGKVVVHDISITKDPDSSALVQIDVKVLSAALPENDPNHDICWIEDHGRDDGNEHNAIVHIEIGMPVLPAVQQPETDLLGVNPNHDVF